MTGINNLHKSKVVRSFKTPLRDIQPVLADLVRDDEDDEDGNLGGVSAHEFLDRGMRYPYRNVRCYETVDIYRVL